MCVLGGHNGLGQVKHSEAPQTKELKNQQNAKKLTFFDEIYNTKVEKERLEKARQSVYETKS